MVLDSCSVEVIWVDYIMKWDIFKGWNWVMMEKIIYCKGGKYFYGVIYF